MKRKFGLWILLFVLIGSLGTLTNSCNKDETPQEEPPLTVTDIDGNVYQTVNINGQIWMAENLKTTRYRNGDAIQNAVDDHTWYNLSTGAFCYYNNDIANKDIYGCLYNGFIFNDSRNIAPEGWHVPTEGELRSLVAYAYDGGSLKETGTLHWLEPNNGATNKFGFNALPGGVRVSGGDFYSLGETGEFWCSTINFDENGFGQGNVMSLHFYKTGVAVGGAGLGYAYSVRCVKD